jgi:hypothetical protein
MATANAGMVNVIKVAAAALMAVKAAGPAAAVGDLMEGPVVLEAAHLVLSGSSNMRWNLMRTRMES